ncbi:MAG TPA: amidohydrolase family protein, partial [Gaiellaceae bacterium]|nr:amidohydrolase family protein [Gaiellaceae bacterium]
RSPDGRTIAFQDESGATSTVDVASGRVRPLAPPRFAPGRPSWSADGRTVAFAALEPYSRRFREGTNRILTIDVATGRTRITEPAPFASIATRGDDGPVYAPDGSAIAFVMDGVLWVRPVDANGQPVGVATRVTSEPADAPTWSRDASRLLYLSNGRLRLVARDGARPETIPVPLEWRAEQTEGATVLHVGKLWDGTGPHAAEGVDVLVVGDRIAEIAPHQDDARERAAASGARFVDASDKTVVPGLWEAHTHHLIAGRPYGDRLGRLWLAYGVTSLSSLGDPAYRAVEAREAFASGARVGPRLFATGEALDGERVYYDVMRPVTSPAQLALELSRAEALGYDMLKTYVRLPAVAQAEVTRFAHERMGVWTGSHYMLPGLAAGVDAMTHVSATTRSGYAYTRSATGRSYADVPALLVGGGMFVISTPFEGRVLLADDPALIDDPRIAVLDTPWHRVALAAKRDRITSGDPAPARLRLAREMATIGAVLDAGGTVLAGSDSPLDDVALALHLNLRAQVRSGRAPWQALQTATSLPARAFGLADDLGTLEPGKVADLVIVDGDPLAQIDDLTRVHAVMKSGRLHTQGELMAPFEAPPRAAR